jgi:hypothetical protein
VQWQEVAEAGSGCQKLAVGLDTGNGRLKVSVGDYRISFPAYLLSVSGLQDWEKPTPSHEGSYLEVVAGTKSELHGHAYLVGNPAYDREPETARQTISVGKVQHALPMLLGAIATLPYRENWSLVVAASLPHVEPETKAQLIDSLAGVYGIRLRDGHHTVVSIEVPAVVPEGLGALAGAGIKGKAVVLDFGAGTTIATAVNGPTVLQRKALNHGVARLFEAIAASDEAIAKLGCKADTAVLRAAIENGTFLYRGPAVQWDFSATYAQSLRKWGSETIPQLMAQMRPYLSGDVARLAIGGGALLPHFGEALASQGFEALPDPVMANARGLKSIAQQLAR